MEDPWGGDVWTAKGTAKLPDAAAAAWADDDGWGGWSDAAGGESPALRPPEPWAAAKAGAHEGGPPDPWAAAKAGEEGEPAVDSAISLGGDGRFALEAAQHVWGAEEPAAGEEEAPDVGEEEAPRPAAEPEPSGPVVAVEDRPETGRHGSRVHELVEVYDGMARRAISPTQAPTKRPARGDVPRAVPDGPPADDGPGTAAAPGRRRNSPGIPFPVDLSKLDELFPETPAAPSPAAPEPEAGDADGFGGASERRAWHRISRLGSARRHDSGADDDSYVRVGWAGSRVRERTLGVVRRWLEQPPRRGAAPGAGGACVFRWDEPAAPVAIGELLRQRRAAQGAASARADEDAWGAVVAPGGTAPGGTAPGGPRLPRGADGPALDASAVAVGKPLRREDEIVAGILRSLPDLTYMLR